MFYLLKGMHVKLYTIHHVKILQVHVTFTGCMWVTQVDMNCDEYEGEEVVQHVGIYPMCGYCYMDT
jgi:hypothetical protein